MTRLVVFDLDETLWKLPGGYCAQMTPPFHRDGDRVSDGYGYQLTLRPDTRSTLESLRSRGVLLSVASRSTPETAGEVLKLLGLLERFTCPCFAWQDKDLSLHRVLTDLREQEGIHIEPPEVLFVDDWPSNIRDAAKLGIPGLVFGQDIHSLSEVLNHLNGSGDKNAVRSI